MCDDDDALIREGSKHTHRRKILIKVVKYMRERAKKKKFINAPSQLGFQLALALYYERGAIKKIRMGV